MSVVATFWGLTLCFLVVTVLVVVAFTRSQKGKQQSDKAYAGQAQKVDPDAIELVLEVPTNGVARTRKKEQKDGAENDVQNVAMATASVDLVEKKREKFAQEWARDQELFCLVWANKYGDEATRMQLLETVGLQVWSTVSSTVPDRRLFDLVCPEITLAALQRMGSHQSTTGVDDLMRRLATDSLRAPTCTQSFKALTREYFRAVKESSRTDALGKAHAQLARRFLPNFRLLCLFAFSSTLLVQVFAIAKPLEEGGTKSALKNMIITVVSTMISGLVISGAIHLLSTGHDSR